MNTSTIYMGMKLRNPVIVGSSGLSSTPEKVKACFDAGAGAVVLKSIFEEQIENDLGTMSGSSWYPEAADYIGRYGMDNAVSRYLDLLKDSAGMVDIPVIPSIHCFGSGKWVDFAARLEDAGAPALELNAFILPSDPRKTGRENEQALLDILNHIKQVVSIPVAVKIGSHFSSLPTFARELEHSGADALVVFNRFYSLDLDIEKLEVIPGTNFSSPQEAQTVTRWVSILHPLLNCDLAATTGVHDGQGLVKQLLAGARAVQISSALYKNGLGTIGTMLAFLVDWMKRHGHTSVDSFMGKMASTSNPAEFLRVQFMKVSVGE